MTPKEGWWRQRNGEWAEIGYVGEDGRMYGISWGTHSGFSEKWDPTGHVRFWGHPADVKPEEDGMDLVEYLGTETPEGLR